MKKNRFTEEQIAFALKQAETRTLVAEALRRIGISEQTVCRWKSLYGGLGTGEPQRPRQMEEENRKLKRFVLDLSLDKHILQDVLAKKLRRLLADASSCTRFMRLICSCPLDASALTRTKAPRPISPTACKRTANRNELCTF